MIEYVFAPGTYVHEGFYDAYLQVQTAVVTKLKKLTHDHSDAEVLVTGHSLGGALALLAALDVSYLGLNPTLYTFGQPRVGDPEFSKHVFKQLAVYERVVHYDDIVPHNPLNALGFLHAGNEVWYDSYEYTPDYKECENVSGEPENPNCSSSFWTQLGVTAHRYYLGMLVSGQCTRLEPGLLGDGIVFEK